MWHDEFESAAIGRDLFGHTLHARRQWEWLAGGGAGAGLSDLFGEKKKPKLLMLPEQRAAYQSLLPAMTQKGMEFMQIGSQPYAGQFTAPLGQHETLGLGTLADYLKWPMPTKSELFGAATGELEKTLWGKEYDPTTGPYYEPYRTNIMRELQQAKDRIAARSSSRDALFGGGRLAQERELEEGVTGSMAQELGRLFEAERARRLGAVPMALQTMGWAEQIPQARIAASQQYGALPRLIQQADLTARYQDYLRQLQNMGMGFEAAQRMAMSTPEYWMPQPTDWSGLSNALGQLGMMMAMGA